MHTDQTPPTLRLRRRLLVVVAAALAALTLAGSHAAAGTASPDQATSVKPTVVLVHGAWADSSGWSDVTKRLQDDGYPVIAVANPLRTLAGDAAYLRSVTDQIPGPVVLVGHSYGGAVITNAAVGSANVVALVYVAGFIPDVGEDVLHIAGAGSQVPASIEFKGFPPFGQTDVDIYIKADMFRSTFAADLPARQTATMAATQRPLAYLAASAPTTQTAWTDIPSWSVIPTNDRTITPDAHQAMAERAGATVVEVRSSHVVMITQPRVVTNVIETAAEATT